MMIHGKKVICVAVILVAAVTTNAWGEDPYEVEWIAQIGTSSLDTSLSVAVDASGNAYISGQTNGDLGGPSAGDYDAFLVKYEVPEPATLSLLAFGGLAILRKWRR